MSKMSVETGRTGHALNASGHAALLLTLMPSLAMAQDQSFAQDVIGLVLPMAFVIATMVGALWFLGRKRNVFKGDGPLRVEQVLEVGPHERILLLRAGGEQLVVGVTASEITFLTRMRPSSDDVGLSLSQTE